MSKLILFNGGRNGGLLTSKNGVRTIPAVDPNLQLILKSASSMVNAVENEKDKNYIDEMAKLSTDLTNLAVAKVENMVGQLDDENSLIYQDDDGGFTCGSTGKPPFPLQWPPNQMPTISDLIVDGIIGTDFVELVDHGLQKRIEIIQLLEEPKEAAKKLGIKISSQSQKYLQMLAPSKIEEIENPIDKEVITFFHEVANDGRYLSNWYTEPFEVSKKLSFDLSNEALELIVSRGSNNIYKMGAGVGPVSNPIAVVAIAITGIIAVTVAVTSKSVNEIIIDKSGLFKI